MLIEFYGRNFGCFRDEFRLSMLATDIERGSDRGVVEVQVEGDDAPLRLLRCAAIYGPNASGKSTVIKAAHALGELLRRSRNHASNDPVSFYEPFSLDPETHEKPVALGAKAVINGAVFDYYVEYTREHIVVEKLTRLSGDEPENLFCRVDRKVEGSWSSNPIFQLIAKRFGRRTLLLSVVDSLAPRIAREICVGFMRHLTNYHPRLRRPFLTLQPDIVARRANTDSAFRDWLLARLKAADVGVADLSIMETPIRYAEGFVKGLEDDPVLAANPPKMHSLSLHHRGKDGASQLPFNKESYGTRLLVELSPLLYDLTHEKKELAAFVDEFDASMHPVLLREIVNHFNCALPMADVRGQLIFAAHETSLIDGEAREAPLRRDQVWFAEKDSTGASQLESVSDFKERQNLNMRRRYLQGRYGALPAIGTFKE